MQPSPEKTVRFSAPPRTMVPGLHAASRDGDVGRVQRMLEDGAPVDEKVSPSPNPNPDPNPDPNPWHATPTLTPTLTPPLAMLPKP